MLRYFTLVTAHTPSYFPPVYLARSTSNHSQGAGLVRPSPSSLAIVASVISVCGNPYHYATSLLMSELRWRGWSCSTVSQSADSRQQRDHTHSAACCIGWAGRCVITYQPAQRQLSTRNSFLHDFPHKICIFTIDVQILQS